MNFVILPILGTFKACSYLVLFNLSTYLYIFDTFKYRIVKFNKQYFPLIYYYLTININTINIWTSNIKIIWIIHEFHHLKIWFLHFLWTSSKTKWACSRNRVQIKTELQFNYFLPSNITFSLVKYTIVL